MTGTAVDAGKAQTARSGTGFVLVRRDHRPGSSRQGRDIRTAAGRKMAPVPPCCHEHVIDGDPGPET